MNDEIDTYSFLPWLRQGVANNISSSDMDVTVKVRTSIDVELTLSGKGVEGPDLTEVISKKVALYGPGDIIGIESKAIIKQEPSNWITNFEPNYLPYIEFYDEDFPWRYTPAAPDSSLSRLRPWIMLVVLTEDEFKDGKNITGKSLPYIDIADAETILPPADQLWAWAHVHVNEDVVKRTDDVENTDMSAVLPRFQAVLDQNPDRAYARILCPRKLDENTAYYAFLIPVFETGRLAGLGLDPAKAPAEVHATFSAWANYSGKPQAQSFPYYFRWYFRTSSAGDFEYLVRLLQPRPVDSRVGRCDIDVQDPGSNLSGITDEELGGILKLGGALKVPFETLKAEEREDVLKYDNWADPYPHPFQRDLARFINLADDYRHTGVPEGGDPDPLITPPLYGRWHALTERLLEARDGSDITPNDDWVHELNLDPRWRVAAGFGTKVVQDNQEEYMDAAWGQIGEVLAANQKIRFAQFAKEAARVWHDKHVILLRRRRIGKALMLTAPIQKRILVDGSTVFHQVKTSKVPAAAMSPPLRRVMRPRSRVVRKLAFTPEIQPDALVTRINAEEVIPVPPKPIPDALPTLDELAEELKPKDLPKPIGDLLATYPWLQYVPLALAAFFLILILLGGLGWFGFLVAAALIAAAVYAYLRLRDWARRIQDAEAIREENQTPEAVERLPKSPDFRISEIGSGFEPSRGASDSAEASRFKSALKDAFTLVHASARASVRPERHRLNVSHLVTETVAAIDPQRTIPRLVLSQILIPQRIVDLIGTSFKEVMAYPEIDLPMYKPLVELSPDLFLPNIRYIGQNTISLLETNQKFIESYMAGLNHEFARELLWREYPTDQRGSYFRQFWDVNSVLNKEDLSDEELRERLWDIPPLHRWKKLGDNDHREQEGDKEEELVLVIRGELLKKYPDAVIYAHRAQWQRNEAGDIDNTKERVLDESTPIENNIKTPLYDATVSPDIYFFGFDLTAEKARGGTGEEPDDDPGWFFVIKERPGEPRFGLDIEQSSEINVWNDLAWEDVIPGVGSGDYLKVGADTVTISLNDPHGDPSLDEKYDQYDEDQHLSWNKDMNAAQLAYILYQVPVLVAVHAAEMLPKE